MTTDIEKIIIAFVNGDLTESESITLMREVEENAEMQKLLFQYQQIEKDLSQGEIVEMPSERLRSKFDSFLTKELANNSAPTKVFSLSPLLKYAATLVVFIAAGVTVWNQLDTDKKSQSYAVEQMVNDLENKSDTERIKAIYVSNNSSIDNQLKIKEVLIQSLKTDNSSHVRLASVETLTEYISDEKVRGALIRALGTEEDPQVQVAIIMALSNTKDRAAIKPLEELIQKEGGYKFVKDEAHVGLMNITSI